MTCKKPAADGGMCLECCIRHAICDYYRRTRHNDGLMDAGEALAMLQSIAAELLADFEQPMAIAFAVGVMSMAAQDRAEKREHEGATH